MYCTARTVYGILRCAVCCKCTVLYVCVAIGQDSFMGQSMAWILSITSHFSPLTHSVTCPYLVINHLSLILPFGHCTPHSALEHKSTGAVDNWCAIAGGLLDADNRADSFNTLMKCAMVHYESFWERPINYRRVE
jgi:hypothetical protein